MSEKPQSWSVTAEIRAEQKAAIKDMSRKEKLAYFWEYYKIHTITILISAVILISIIYNMATSKDYAFYAVILNSYGLSRETLADDFSTFAEIDTDRVLVYIETETHLNIDDFSPFDMATVQRIMATIAAGQLDAIVTDASSFIYFSDAEFFGDLRLILSAEELKRHENRLFYIDQDVIDKKNANPNFDNIEIIIKTPEEKIQEIKLRRQPENMINPVPVGIFMTESQLIQSAFFGNDFPVLGIIGTSRQHENARMFVDFLLK
ncbi:MAG: hypothetical protein FWE14_02860 [Lachnospiraceae bacterium]|nr:hypothetical protein [Lachnospiraceae bacterium]